MRKVIVLLMVGAFLVVAPAAEASPPSNDAFANATAISSTPFSTTESTVDATLEPNEPNPVCLPLDHTVWFRYTATRNATLVANLTGSNFNVAAGLYQGTSLSNLKAVGCLDNAPPDAEPTLGFSVSRGKTYYLQIGSLSGFPGGTLNVRVEPAGAIQGTVHDDKGRLLNGACVTAWDANRLYAASTNTVHGGMYSLPFLSSGEYRIKFEDCNALVDAPEWYDNATSFAAATALTLPSGGTIKNINATLVRGGSISGVLTVEGSGDAAVDACVRAYDSDGTVEPVIPNAASDGSYTIGQLAAGSYRLEFNGEGCASGYFPEWYSDKKDFASADPIVVSVGQAVTGVDAQLRSTSGTGSISGTVTDDVGNPVQPICAEAVVPQNGVAVTGVLTSGDGTYTIPGLATGTYKVVFGNCWTTQQYQVEWYQEKSDISSADPVSVTDGVDTPGIDEVMTPSS